MPFILAYQGPVLRVSRPLCHASADTKLTVDLAPSSVDMSPCELSATGRLLWVCRCGLGLLWVSSLVLVRQLVMNGCESVAVGCLLWVGHCE